MVAESVEPSACQELERKTAPPSTLSVGKSADSLHRASEYHFLVLALTRTDVIAF
jgi:hypothetical protein